MQIRPKPLIGKRRSAGRGLPPPTPLPLDVSSLHDREEPQLPPLPDTPIEQPTIKPKTIKLKTLPDVLSSWIEGENPKNIYQIASPKKGTGFNVIAWKDQNGSKLFLEDLDPKGTVNESLMVTFPQFQTLAEMSGWNPETPHTIIVKLKLADDLKSDLKSLMAAKKMVLRLLNFYQNSFELPNKPILKETKTDNLGGREFAIEFSVKGITQIEPIMIQNVFGQKINLDYPQYAARFGLRNPKAIYDALKDYQEKLQAGVVNGFRVEEVDPTGAMFQEIKTAADNLIKKIDTTIKGTKPPVLDTLEKLQEQVESAIDNGFRNELDTRRWQQWLTGEPKPLTEDVIVPGTGTQIGEGIQGPVFKYELDPALGRRPVVLKYDGNRLNEEAIGAGIPEINPQQSVRAVAAFKISQKLNLSVIPQTEFFVGTDDNGRPILGQTMEFVNGTIGQRTAATGEPVPVDIDYGNPVVQKGLSDLQVFDSIIGHADRNAGKWIYEKQGDTIIGVKGIDNDETFGAKWLPMKPETPGGYPWSSKTPGIPPIVDISTALSILNADFKDIRPLLAGLSVGEINKAGERFDEVKRQVGARKIASMGDVGDQAKLQQLRNKVPVMGPMPDILRWGNQRIAGEHTGRGFRTAHGGPIPSLSTEIQWGNQGIAGEHTEQYSYLGFQLARWQLALGGTLPRLSAEIQWGNQGIAGEHTEQNSYLGFELGLGGLVPDRGAEIQSRAGKPGGPGSGDPGGGQSRD